MPIENRSVNSKTPKDCEFHTIPVCTSTFCSLNLALYITLFPFPLLHLCLLHRHLLLCWPCCGDVALLLPLSALMLLQPHLSSFHIEHSDRVAWGKRREGEMRATMPRILSAFSLCRERRVCCCCCCCFVVVGCCCIVRASRRKINYVSSGISLVNGARWCCCCCCVNEWCWSRNCCCYFFLLLWLYAVGCSNSTRKFFVLAHIGPISCHFLPFRLPLPAPLVSPPRSAPCSGVALYKKVGVKVDFLFCTHIHTLYHGCTRQSPKRRPSKWKERGDKIARRRVWSCCCHAVVAPVASVVAFYVMLRTTTVLYDRSFFRLSSFMKWPPSLHTFIASSLSRHPWQMLLL